MANRRTWQHSERPASWPAWCASLAIHASLMLVTVVVVRQHAIRGAIETPTRDVGIVLMQKSEKGPLFEDETLPEPIEATLEQTEESTVGQATQQALPAESEIPSTEDSLPQLPTLGLGAPDQGGVADAREMTRGSPASKNVGKQATVSLFGVEGTGTKFVYVFDRSISMEGPPLRAAKTQLVKSLESLESLHQFQIIFFNHEPLTWDITRGQRRIAFATDRNKRLAEKFIRSVSASGGTYRRAALQLALRMRPDVIFFLTDADDPMPKTDVARAIDNATRHATAINSIEFGNGPTRGFGNFLIQLARDTSGRYAYVDTLQLEK